MKSNSENSFGARLDRARKLSAILKTFLGYDPEKEGLYIPDYDALITLIALVNDEIAVMLQEYSLAVDHRQNLFTNDKDSLEKILSPLGAAVILLHGKKSKQISDIKGMVKKIRGVSKKKGTEEMDPKFISQSQQSFGSLTQTFSDIVASIENYGSAYNPPNNDIKLPALQEKVTKLIAANKDEATTDAVLALKRDERNNHYKTISETTQYIKYAVQLQYGINSPEYKLIKGIVV